jgi:hypothetical protein
VQTSGNVLLLAICSLYFISTIILNIELTLNYSNMSGKRLPLLLGDLQPFLSSSFRHEVIVENFVLPLQKTKRRPKRISFLLNKQP